MLKGDGAKRSLRDEIYCNAVKFSPSGDAWAAASSQGLMVYTLDPSLTFDPFDLDEDVTPASIRYALAGEEWSKALIYALHLNEEAYIRTVLRSVPFKMDRVMTAFSAAVPPTISSLSPRRRPHSSGVTSKGWLTCLPSTRQIRVESEMEISSSRSFP